MNPPFKFCPKCGQKYAPQTNINLVCEACKFVFYQNSKPTASTLIINDQNQVLLGKRAIEPGKGKWDVIGGFLELGETPEAGAIREAKEEAGVDVQIESYVGIFMDSYSDWGIFTLNIGYTAKIIAGELKPGDDIAELAWFNLDNLPTEIAYDNGKAMLAKLSAQLHKKLISQKQYPWAISFEKSLRTEW